MVDEEEEEEEEEEDDEDGVEVAAGGATEDGRLESVPAQGSNLKQGLLLPPHPHVSQHPASKAVGA